MNLLWLTRIFWISFGFNLVYVKEHCYVSICLCFSHIQVLKCLQSHITLDIERIDRLGQEGNLSQDLIVLRNLRRKELGEVLLKEEVHWRQSSRIKWIKEGDSKSKFFHSGKWQEEKEIH